MQMHLCRSGLRGRIVPEALVWHQIPAGRCTPPWCLRRAYLSGLIKGLLAARYEQRRPRLLGGIRCVLGNVRTRLTSLPLKEVIRLSRPGRFAVRSALKWMHGFIVGYRQAQWNNIDPMAVTTNSASKLSLTSTATVSHS